MLLRFFNKRRIALLVWMLGTRWLWKRSINVFLDHNSNYFVFKHLILDIVVTFKEHAPYSTQFERVKQEAMKMYNNDFTQPND